MPSKLSWSDTFAAAVVPDTISYILPTDKSYDAAPSQIVIDGYATLVMQRTRVSVHGNEQLNLVDNKVRQPMYVAPTAPQPASPQNAPAPAIGAVERKPTSPLLGVLFGFGGGFCLAAAMFAPLSPVAVGVYVFIGLCSCLVSLLLAVPVEPERRPAQAAA